jgi:putative ABC transport system substrate-binding protein
MSKDKKPKLGRWQGFCTAAVALILGGVSAQAQQSAKVPWIGYLNVASLSGIAGRTEAFRQGLGELGYSEGKNLIIEWRSAEGKRS